MVDVFNHRSSTEYAEGAASINGWPAGSLFISKYGIWESICQVVHNGFGHWLTVTNIGAESAAEVMVYDSLYPSISMFMQKQIATLLHTSQKEIKVNIMNMQVQSGTCDCGLFAIATATSLVNGVHPGAVTFKQSEMRRHLYDCFRSGRLTSFPVLKSRRAVSKIKYTESFPVYCTCRMIELPSRECTNCLEWFHVDCQCLKMLFRTLQ